MANPPARLPNNGIYDMSRSGKDPNERLRTAKKRTASSSRWLTRQINDPYVKQARAEGWRSRAEI